MDLHAAAEPRVSETESDLDLQSVDEWASGLRELEAAPAPEPAPEPRVADDRNRREIERRDATFRRSLAAADALAVAVPFALWAPFKGLAWLALGVLTVPLIILGSKLQGLYDRDELLVHKTTLDEAPKLFGLTTFGTLVAWLLSPAVPKHIEVNAGQVLLLWGSLFVLVVLFRRVARIVAGRLAPPERCLFIGSACSYARLEAKLAANGDGALLVGGMALVDGKALVSLRSNGRGHAVASGPAQTLENLIAELDVHRIIIEPSEPSPELTLEFVRNAKRTGIHVSLLPRILEVVGSSIEIDDLDGLTLLGVRRFGLTRSSRLVKRSFDIVGSVLGLLVLAPLLALIAVLIKLDSRGPVIFKQTRMGRGDNSFEMWKFRTMVPDADERKSELRALNEAVGLFKIADDPRITRVGRRLRQWSLDELPQLRNVLYGEMSLVGPRPLVVDEDNQIDGNDRRRLELTPGMTGHWQILGSARVPLKEMVKLDYLYVAGWSLWNDVKILLRTVPYVLFGRGQ